MLKCSYCGRDHDDSARNCVQCGRSLGGEPQAEPAVVPNPSATPPSGSSPWENIAVLEYEVEAEHLGAELTNRNIPHVMRSYHDSALDGLFQLSRGWGHVEAPREYKDAIVAILKDLREPGADS